MSFDKATEAADFIRSRYQKPVKTAVVLGSGLGAFADGLENAVTIAYEVSDEMMKFVITDQGTGFDPAECPHAACDEDPVSHLDLREKLGMRQGGFGIMIAKGMVDKVEYNDTGNQVTLTKHFTTLPSAAAQA